MQQGRVVSVNLAVVRTDPFTHVKSGRSGIDQRFFAAGRPGASLAVEQPAAVSAGDPVRCSTARRTA
jgi:hypothetical protein